MSWGGAAGGILGGISSTIGGMMQAGADEATANQNVGAIAANNELNWQRYLQTRGQGGNAILPMYADTGTEKALFDNAVAASKAIYGGDAAGTMANYQQIVDKYKPVVNAQTDLVGGIYNGTMLSNRLNDLAPVNAARVNAAEANAQAVNMALQQQQNQVRAQLAAQGFGGGSSYGNNRMLGAAIPALQQAAGGRANAALQNAGAIQALQENQRALQLNSLNLPSQMVSQEVGMSQLPATALANLVQASQSPLNYWKIGVGNAPQAQTPLRAFTTDPGAAAAYGVGSMLSNAGGMMGGLSSLGGSSGGGNYSGLAQYNAH